MNLANDDVTDVDVVSEQSASLLQRSFSNSSRLFLSMRDHLVTKSSSTNNNDSERCQIRLVLASGSQRRREILEMMGLEGKFDIIPSPLDEAQLQSELTLSSSSSMSPQQKSEDEPHFRSNNYDHHQIGRRVAMGPKEYVRILAEEKAKALANLFVAKINADCNSAEAGHEPSCSLDLKLNVPTLIIGSDTIVDLDGFILEKPKDEQDAKSMIRALSNRDHSVHTGVAIYQFIPTYSATAGATTESTHDSPAAFSLQSSFVDTICVEFADLTENDIDSYVATGEPMKNAGSYTMQGIGGQLVASIQGDFFTGEGLPMHRLSLELNQVVKQIITVVGNR